MQVGRLTFLRPEATVARKATRCSRFLRKRSTPPGPCWNWPSDGPGAGTPWSQPGPWLKPSTFRFGSSSNSSARSTGQDWWRASAEPAGDAGWPRTRPRSASPTSLMRSRGTPTPCTAWTWRTTCFADSHCGLQELWGDIDVAIRQVLERTTLADLAERHAKQVGLPLFAPSELLRPQR
jgi:hypothetical protein